MFGSKKALLAVITLVAFATSAYGATDKSFVRKEWYSDIYI